MIQDVSDQLFQKFTDAMRRELETPAAATPEAAPPAPPPAENPNPPVAAIAEPAAAPPPPKPQPPASENVLDVGSLGATAAGRAAARTLSRPGFWIAVIVLALLVYWLVNR
jgi:hypothetical protein